MRFAHDWGRAFARPNRSATVHRTIVGPALLAIASGALWAGCTDSTATAPHDTVLTSESVRTVEMGIAYPMVRIQPGQVSLAVGGHTSLRAKLIGPNQNTWMGRDITWKSSDPSVASVSMTGWGGDNTGHVVGHKNGTATITATTESNTTGTVKVTVGNGSTPSSSGNGDGDGNGNGNGNGNGHGNGRGNGNGNGNGRGHGGAHEPGGMQEQINTGPIRSTGTFAVFSSSSRSSQGESSDNLSVVPGGSGLRITYRPDLAGGYSPVRFGMAINSPGTGWYYQRMKVRFSPNWTLNGNIGLKFCEPRTQQQGSVSGANENHVISMSDFLTQSRHAFLMAFLQGPYSQARDLFEQPLYSSNADLNDGAWHTIEILFVPESRPGAGDGQYRGWVDGAEIAHYTNVRFLAPGNQAGWPYLMFDPTYGGGNNSPSSTMYWDFDELYVSTR